MGRARWTRNARPRAFPHRRRRLGALTAVCVFVTSVLVPEPALAGPEAVIFDDSLGVAITWVVVVGAPEQAGEAESWKDDTDELKSDLADGVVGYERMTEPSKTALLEMIHDYASTASPGSEFVLFFVGHSNTVNPIDSSGEEPPDPGNLRDGFDDVLMLNGGSDEGESYIKDDALAAALKDFPEDVSVTLILSTCFGVKMGDGDEDFKDNGLSRRLVAANSICPIEPPPGFGNFGWEAWIETFTEAIANGAGDEDADGNGDGKVTVDELYDWLVSTGPHNSSLPGAEWDVEDPKGSRPKHGASNGPVDGPVPDVDMWPPRDMRAPQLARFPSLQFGPVVAPGDVYVVRGTDFGRRDIVEIALGDVSGGRLILKVVSTNRYGKFRTKVTVPAVLPGEYMLWPVADDLRNDWVAIEVVAA